MPATVACGFLDDAGDPCGQPATVRAETEVGGVPACADHGAGYTTAVWAYRGN